MIKYVGGELLPDFLKKILFITHSGEGHADDVLAAAIFEMAMCRTTDIIVIRTRDPEIIKKGDVVVDVGGGELDHHGENFHETRESGEGYASAGIIWNLYGNYAIRNVATREKFFISGNQIMEINKKIDREVILPVDMDDTGEKKQQHMFSFVKYFMPTWLDDEQDYDRAFWKAENLSYKILYHVIKEKIVEAISIKLMDFTKVTDGILEIHSQNFPWKENVLEYNKINPEKQVRFVVFKYTDGTSWAAQAVPPSMEREFEQLIPFPEKWGGKTDQKLAELCDVPDAIMCHKGLFFARAKSKEGILEMCKIAQGIAD